MEIRNILVHTHIFKNAGSSFDDALQRNFKDNFVDHRDDHLIHKDKEFLSKYIKENQNVEAFSSHSIYDKPIDFENVQYHTCYFVRHPIDRIKSVYSFEHKQPAQDSLGAKMAKEFDFKGYVNWRMQSDVPPTIRNLQTVFVAGMGKGTGRMEMRYELALKTLEENPLIALVDRYDESMVVFEEYLSQFFPNIDLSYIRRNITDKKQNITAEEKAKKLLDDLGEELAQKVIENNKYDIELYKKTQELLDERINKIENFQQKLENFQQRCEELKEKGEVTIKPLFKKIKEAIVSPFEKNKNFQDKKNIILHIGRHKSGTSSLQKFLCDNEKTLEEKGYYYPKKLRRNIAHHPLAYFYNDNLKTKLSNKDLDEIKDFWEEIKDKNNIIISSEAFQNINPNNLKKDFEKYNIIIVVYLRDQVSYLLSSYAQAIQNQKLTKTLEEYESTNFKDMDYLKFLKKWEKAFPSAKMIVRLFDKKTLNNEDIRKDFMINSNICNELELNNLIFENKDQNPSIGGALLEFKRLLNYTDFDKFIKTNKIYETLGKMALENENYKLQKSIKKDIYDKIITKYEESNQKVSKIYLKGDNISMQKSNFGNLNLPLTEIEKSKILNLFSKFGINLNKFNIETSNHILENTPGLEKFFLNQNNNKYDRILELFKTESNNSSNDINTINNLLNDTMTYEELIALSTVTKMFFRKNEHFKDTLNKISEKLTLLKIPNIKKNDNISINHITLISSTVRTDGEHIKIIYGLLISLLSSDFKGKISLILTSEMEWFTWRRINYEDNILKYKILFKDLVNKSNIKEKTAILNFFENNVSIVIAPRLEEFNNYLGEVIFRFIGYAAFRTTFVASKNIYENKTVITVPYSSMIATTINTDLLLTRHNKRIEKMFHYHPPLLLPKIEAKTNYIKDITDNINIVTVYSQNRIQIGIKNFKNKDWIKIKDLFQKNKKLKWIFIGAEDINKVYNHIPKEILDLERIEIYGFKNLQEIYKENSFFLALPNIPGGGGGALLAILSKIPVFAHNNNKSDISSLVSEEFLFNDLEMQINQIEFYIENKEKLDEIKQKQFNFINKMSDMREKGQELYSIIKKVHLNKGAL